MQAADNDGDGLSTCNGDCDDTDPETKKRRVYLDADEDGVGSNTTFEYSCEPIEGYVSQKGDCDDADPNVHNLDLDEDGLSTCNGDCDDNDPNIKRIKQYEDLDGDGQGLSSNWIFSCENQEGYVEERGDCDDRVS